MSLCIPALTTDKSQEESISVSESVFGQAFNEPLIHQIVVAYMAAARSGTKEQKSRSDVRGGGRKPWRQKGTGQARAGTTRSPLWRSGGVTFAARNRIYKQKVNKKMYRAAIRSILSEMLRQERLVISDDITPSLPKTKAMRQTLDSLGINTGLIVTESFDQNLWLATRNLPDVFACTSDSIDPVSLIRSEKVVFTRQAIKNIEVWLE
jgi:large subunit ribosomal protein L4